MAQPRDYTRQHDFSDFQTTSPAEPLRGTQVDAELDNVKLTLDDLNTNIGLIQRDDGKLGNASVHKDAFDTGSLALMSTGSYTPRGDWVTSTAYVVGDLVDFNDSTFLATTAHTAAASFSADSAYWILLANAAISGANFAVDKFEGNGSTTAFTLTYNYTGNEAVQVYVNGALRNPGDDYTISGTTLTFFTAPSAPAVSGNENVIAWGPPVVTQAAANAAAASASNSGGFADESERWASKVDGIVETTDYSSKAYAVGGTGVSTGSGSSKDWATKTGGTVGNTSEYSSKKHAADSSASASASETSKLASVAAQAAAETAETNAETAETNSAASASASQVSRLASVAAQGLSETAQTASETALANATTQTGLATAQVALATTQASTATTQASTATTQAGIATTKAAEAAASAASITDEEANAAASATAASGSATSAANSAASAATALDNFEDKYLGSLASEPTTDLDGNALVSGALYFSQSSSSMQVYDGANWIAASSAGVSSLNLFEYTATAGQTTFSGTDDNGLAMSFIAGNNIFALNGIILDPSDFNDTSGTSVVLADAAVVGDLLNAYCFKSFTVADTVSASGGGTFSGNVTVNGTLTATTFSPDFAAQIADVEALALAGM